MGTYNKLTGKSAWGPVAEVMKDVKVCDLIEVQRPGYRHFGTYVGRSKATDEGIVSHIFKKNGKGKKVLEPIQDVAGNDRARINNLKKEAKNRHLRKLPKEEQLKAALSGLEKTATTDAYYNLFYNNCETQATKNKYKTGFSKQKDNLVKRILTGKFSIAEFLKGTSGSSREEEEE